MIMQYPMKELNKLLINKGYPELSKTFLEQIVNETYSNLSFIYRKLINIFLTNRTKEKLLHKALKLSISHLKQNTENDIYDYTYVIYFANAYKDELVFAFYFRIHLLLYVCIFLFVYNSP